MQVLTSTKSSAAVVLGALEVLRPLSRDADSKEMLRDAGAFRPLLSALQLSAASAPAPSSSSPGATQPTSVAPSEEAVARREAAECAVGVLRNLATSPANQDALRTAGAVKVLISLLGSGEESTDGGGDAAGGEASFVLSAKAAATAATALSTSRSAMPPTRLRSVSKAASRGSCRC